MGGGVYERGVFMKEGCLLGKRSINDTLDYFLKITHLGEAANREFV